MINTAYCYEMGWLQKERTESQRGVRKTIIWLYIKEILPKAI